MSNITKGKWYAKRGNTQMCSLDSTVASLGDAQVFTTAKSLGDAFSDAKLIASSKKLLKHLKTMHLCYAKGIQPSVGTLKEIDALLRELK